MTDIFDIAQEQLDRATGMVTTKIDGVKDGFVSDVVGQVSSLLPGQSPTQQTQTKKPGFLEQIMSGQVSDAFSGLWEQVNFFEGIANALKSVFKIDFDIGGLFSQIKGFLGMAEKTATETMGNMGSDTPPASPVADTPTADTGQTNEHVSALEANALQGLNSIFNSLEGDTKVKLGTLMSEIQNGSVDLTNAFTEEAQKSTIALAQKSDFGAAVEQAFSGSQDKEVVAAQVYNLGLRLQGLTQ